MLCFSSFDTRLLIPLQRHERTDFHMNTFSATEEKKIERVYQKDKRRIKREQTTDKHQKFIYTYPYLLSS